ncbi:membrane protein insertion efficiency factor YidD [Candidatus Poribacteria bacterium]|nr:MAG: membrane protein insertion efficiency factor YidD [Candidatus Poribacteria bacterium]
MFSFTFTVTTDAREIEDLQYIRQTNPILKQDTPKDNSLTLTEISELKLAATGLIRLYQKFISSQDGPTCQFTPTCSRFGMACIHEYGIFRGILLAADRLIRCNYQLSHFYQLDFKMNKYIDPITDYAK